MLNNKLKPQYNGTINSLQFHRLVLKSNENTEYWMGRPRLAAVECSYEERDRKLKEQFIHRLYDNDMLVKIIRKLTKIEKVKM